MSENRERILELQEKMQELNIDMYLVPTADFHQSEYVGDYFKARKWLSGFSGSAGTLLVTDDQAYLWTDGRYFIQAAKELEDTGVTLMKMREPGVPTVDEFLEMNLAKGSCLACDGRVISVSQGKAYKKMMEDKGGRFYCQEDLLDGIWNDRPELSKEPAYLVDIKYVGTSREEKIEMVRRAMKKYEADVHILSRLDDIAWRLNIRGNDIIYNPVVLSYVIVKADEVTFYVQDGVVSDEIKNELEKAGVVLRPYFAIYEEVKTLAKDSKILLDEGVVNYTLFENLPEEVTTVNAMNPTKPAKAMKNAVEMENERIAHIRDGVAVTKFIYWLKKNVGRIPITELSAAEKLYEFRSEQEDFIDNSFDPIIAYGKHAAIVHYFATPETDIPLEPSGFLLADTGGHYKEGTTDITRTIVMGLTSEEEKKYFTAVLRGTLNLGAARFLHGCTGVNLDILARQPLWEMGEDFKHGTGHGVGYLLNVHEGPNSFRWKTVPGGNAVLEEGMITSDEPGYYREDGFGIRHENLMVCKKAEKTEYGQFMCFEFLTMVPFDLDGVVPELMSVRERNLLNDYHAQVYEKISPYLNEEEKEWLKDATRAI